MREHRGMALAILLLGFAAAVPVQAGEQTGSLQVISQEGGVIDLGGDGQMLRRDSDEDLVGAAESLPSSWETPVPWGARAQGSLNLCWAYAPTESLRINQAYQGKEDTVEYSPGHLAYSAFHGTGDTWVTGSSNKNWASLGGTVQMASSTLFRRYGLAAESRYATGSELTLTDETRQDDLYWLAQWRKLENPNAYETDTEDFSRSIAAIREAVQTYGSVTVDLRSKPFDETTQSFYHSEKLSVDHEAVIIGWDDEKVTKADKPGAFKIRNSWGESWGDAGDGWISYYDRTLKNPCVYLADALPAAEQSTELYSYDGTGYYRWRHPGNGETCSSANVFTAGEDGRITRVSFYMPADATARVQILTGMTDGTPNTGTAVLTQQVRSDAFGCYTVELDQAVEVRQGQRFAVAVQTAADDGEYYAYFEGTSAGYRSTTAAEGESFYASSRLTGGRYVDETKIAEATDDQLYSLGNACIRAYIADYPAASERFTDVSQKAYYADALTWMTGRGITVGTTATTFSPDDSCTRAQIVTFLWRLAGEPQSTRELTFADVPQGAYYRQAVAWALEQGITVGTTATTFSPGQTCTRAQIVTFLWRLAGEPQSTAELPFTDVPQGAYYRQAVAWALEKKITAGTTATTFSPQGECLRGQVAQFLYRTYRTDPSLF